MRKKRLFCSFELQLNLYLRSVGRKDSTIQEYKYAIGWIEQFFYFKHKVVYEPEITEQFRRTLKLQFEKHSIPINHYRLGRRASIYLDNFYNGRRICLLSREEKPQPEICRLNLQYKERKRVLGHDVLPAFSTDEIKAILKVPNRNTAEGLRDYAMIILATFTGMRGCDILNLKITDVDFEKKSLSFKQTKTGTLIELPVDEFATSSIQDYIKKGRPENCKNNYLFVSHKYPYGKIINMSSIFRPILIKSGIDKQSKDGKGFHSIRRSMGTWLLESGNRPEMISQVLGHVNQNMFTHYISLSPNSLRDCLIPLGKFKCNKEGLL